MKVVISLTNNEIYEFDLADIRSVSFSGITEIAEPVKEEIEAIVPEAVFTEAVVTPTVAPSNVTSAVVEPEPRDAVSSAIDTILEPKKEEPVAPVTPVAEPVKAQNDAGFTESIPVQTPKVYAVDSAVGEVVYRIDNNRQIRVAVEEIPVADTTPREV